MSDKPVILIDGSSYLYRAFHALPPLTNSAGKPTGAVYGVVNMIRKLINDFQPQQIAVIFDPKGKTHRDEIYAEYKAHRPAMPDDLSSQIQPLFEIITAMGLPLLIVEGMEADDVIGTLAYQARLAKKDVLISTGDKDMAQLVDERVKLINTMTNVVYDREKVIEKFGVPPEQIIDYFALIGDKIDNIPGVPGVGPKTAEKWLKQHCTLENLLQNANQISGSVGESLRNNLEQVVLSKHLVTIMTDMPLPLSVEELNRKPPDNPKLIELFRDLEFRSWLSELLEKQTEEIKTDYETILDKNRLTEVFAQLNGADVIGFDIETNSLDAMKAEIVGFSFSSEPNKGCYIPIKHDYLGVPEQLAVDEVLAHVKKLLENSSKTIIVHDIKYILNVLSRYKVQLAAKCFDTMLQSYVINSAAARHDRDGLALKYLGRRTVTFEEVAGKGAKQISFDQVAIENAGPFAAEDADVTLQLHKRLDEFMDEKLRHIFETIEMPLAKILATVEQNGVLIDEKMLTQQSIEIGKKCQEIEEQVYLLAGEKFNLGSPKQLQAILYEKLNLPIIIKTPTGQPSTSEPVLQELADKFPLPKLILEYRSLSKLKSTYTDRLPLQINPNTGRVHTSYNQAVTATGRLSSTDPNLQNIPIKTEEGRKIRKAFIAPKGYQILACDYSQIELRLMAHFSNDENLLRAFSEGIDIHQATAAEVFNTPLDQVTHAQRRSAKAINFGLIYGMSSFGLTRQLNVDRNVAQAYIDLYFERYPGVRAYMENTRRLAHEQGFVETLHGRRLYLPEINSRNLQRQRASERAAINAPLQGTAADIIKLAMIRLADDLAQSGLDIKMIMQVHDELVFEVKDGIIEEAKALIKKCMCEVVDLRVPLAIDIGCGLNWDEAH